MKRNWIFLLAGLLLMLVLAACQPATEPEQAELGTGVAFVEDVVVEERDGEYWAIVEGFYPDSCSTYGGSSQEVEGDTIHLTVTSTRPEDVGCAQMLTEMSEEILLDTDGLAPGEYTVIANEGRMTTFVIS